MCGLRVTIVVDASASIDASTVRAALSAIVDALVDTDSTLAVVEFSTTADVRIGATALDVSSRDSFDGYIAGFSPGGSSNLGAGLAAAAPGSPDLTLVVTDGVVNAGGATPADALPFAVQTANQLKAGGSRIVAVGVGNADTATLAAISGAAAGSDVARSDYSVGGADAIAASLNTAASDGCAPAVVAAADVGILAGPSDFPNTGAITSPPLPGAVGPASPYPSSITVSGMTGLVNDVNVHLFGGDPHHRPGHRPPARRPRRAEHRGDVRRRQRRRFWHHATPTSPSTTMRHPQVPATGSITGNCQLPADEQRRRRHLPGTGSDPSTNTLLNTAFSGIDPNGTWSLYAVDDLNGDTGSISGGWSLTITTAETAVATATAVTSAPNPSTTGTNVTFTATVTSSGSPVTEGTVTFSDQTTGIQLAANVAVVAGQASTTTTALAEGTHLNTRSAILSPGRSRPTGRIWCGAWWWRPHLPARFLRARPKNRSARKCARPSTALPICRSPKSKRLEYLRITFFAPGNDPKVWLGGWNSRVHDMESHAREQTPVDDYFAAGTAPILDLQAEQDR